MSGFLEWSTTKLKEYIWRPQGGLYIDEAVTERAMPSPDSNTSVSYRLYTMLGKPTQVEINTSNLKPLQIQRELVSIPIERLGAEIEMPESVYNGTAEEFSLDWQEMLDKAVRTFMLEMQNKAELGYSSSNLEQAGYLQDSRILNEPAPFQLKDFQLVSADDGNKFRNFLSMAILKTFKLSKREFKSDSMIVPMELIDLFTTNIPYYAGAGESAVEYLERKGVKTYFSENANIVGDGRIIVYSKDFVELITTHPIEIKQNLVRNQGYNMYVPVRLDFAGCHFFQPLSAFYFDNCLANNPNTPVPNPPAKKQGQ